jgi:hypothetical protein
MWFKHLLQRKAAFWSMDYATIRRDSAKDRILAMHN